MRGGRRERERGKGIGERDRIEREIERVRTDWLGLLIFFLKKCLLTGQLYRTKITVN